MRVQTVTTKQLEVQRIVELLSKAIAQHRLRPGARLIEAQIVETLQANRNHVQVALQRLALQHIVTIEANRGAMVAQPSAREARDVFAARRAIERAIVEAITPQVLDHHRSRLEQRMLSEREVVHSNDRQAILRELGEFHLMLGEICGNGVLADMLANLMVRSSLIVGLYQRNNVPACACDEHQQIIHALEQGRQDQAVALMVAHLNTLEAQLDLAEQPAPEVNLREALAGL
jgi:DNA-binding GntR family transcriptional regulator